MYNMVKHCLNTKGEQRVEIYRIVVDHLLSMFKALSSNLVSSKRKKSVYLLFCFKNYFISVDVLPNVRMRKLRSRKVLLGH